MKPDLALADLRPPSAGDLARCYQHAVASGANDVRTRLRDDAIDSLSGVVGCAVSQLSDLGALALLVQKSLGTGGAGGDSDLIASLMRSLRDRVASEVWTIDRALELYGRASGDCIELWRAKARRQAQEVLVARCERGMQLVPTGQLRETARELGFAVAALEVDEMAVRERLSLALGNLLALYVFAVGPFASGERPAA
jgi:hypothetical protein